MCNQSMPSSFFIARVFIYASLLALVVSCHKHEVMEEDPYAVSFTSDMEDSETRATVSGLEQYATEFYVYGYKRTVADLTQTVFDGELVQWTQNTAHSSNSNTCDWEYVLNGQYIRYWDFSSKEYRFFGTTSSSSATVDSENQRVSWTFTGLDADNVSSAPFFSHQWYSNNSGSYPAYASTVQLSFLRPFCQVCIKFITEEGGQYANTDVLQQNSIKFAPTTSAGALITKGDFTVTYPMSGDDKEYSFAATSTTTMAAITEPYETGTLSFASSLEKWYTLIPPTPSTQGDYTLSVKLGKEDKQITIPANMMQWKPGFRYTYTFKIPDDAGIFLLDVSSVAILSWTDQNVSHPVYNW